MSRKKFRLENLPIIIGDHALDMHKIVPLTGAESSEAIPIEPSPLQLMITQSDYENMGGYFGQSEVVTPWCIYMRDDKGVLYYLRWYSFTYESLIHSAVRIRSKLVVDKHNLLVMLTLPAFDKKNKITRNQAKKYLQDSIAAANSII
jgi:hypothetical protein